MNRFVRFAHGVFVRSGHKAERLAFLQVDMRSVSRDAKSRRRLLKRIELREKFRFG
jgi:hypothetical protein